MNNIYSATEYNASSTYNVNDIITYNGQFNSMTITNGFLYCISNGTTGAFDATKWAGYILDNGDTKPYFIWTPSYQSKVLNKPFVRKLQFGDSYESRMTDGINNNLLTYDLGFDNINIDETTAILHFLTQRNGVESFIFFGRPPYYKASRYVAESWDDSEEFENNFSIKTQFVQKVN